jgi:hypothetical protein
MTIVLAVAALGSPASVMAQATAKPAPSQGAAPTEADLARAIDQLVSFDLATRTNAARTVRRAAPATAAPALERAARSHKDEYVRFRAAVLLTGMSDTAGPLMRQLLTDRNDRLRTVAYQWWEHHADAAILTTLLAALPRERSEFVRPALTRAIAAHGSDPRAREALVARISSAAPSSKRSGTTARRTRSRRLSKWQSSTVRFRTTPSRPSEKLAIQQPGRRSSRSNVLRRPRCSQRSPRPSAC